MPNLIEQMGAPYFTEKFGNSYFTNDGRVYQVLDAQRTDRIRVHDAKSDEIKVLPASVFTGFKVFEYPLLGYRKFGDHLYGYASKKQTSNRGFRIEQVMITWSACSRALMDLGLAGRQRVDDKRKAIALLQPQFDSLKDLPKLLEGKVSGLVLNSNIMIEPSTENADGWYTVLYKQAAVGAINSRGDVKWKNPAFAEVINLTVPK